MERSIYSKEARRTAVAPLSRRRSAPPGEGEGTNPQRQILASPLTPHRTVGSAWKPRKTSRGKAGAVAISHGGCGSNLQGRRAMQEKYVQRGPPNKSPAASLGQGEVGRGIQDLTELVRVEHPPQDAPFFLLALSSCDRKPDCLAPGGARKKNKRQLTGFSTHLHLLPLPGILRWSTLPLPRDVSGGDP